MHFINVKHKSGLYAVIIKFIRHFIFMDVNPWIRKRKMSPYYLIQNIRHSRSGKWVLFCRQYLRHIPSLENLCVFTRSLLRRFPISVTGEKWVVEYKLAERLKTSKYKYITQKALLFYNCKLILVPRAHFSNWFTWFMPNDDSFMIWSLGIMNTHSNMVLLS